MSLYNMLFGESSNAEKLISMLGLTKDSFYRYRDCYLADDGRIAVYTRGGGGNRECWTCEESIPKGSKPGDVVTLYPGKDYQETVTLVVGDDGDVHTPSCVIPMQMAMRAHPCYLSDDDDDFDCTYATFYFRVPVEADKGALVGIQPELARDEVWQVFLTALQELRPEPASKS